MSAAIQCSALNRLGDRTRLVRCVHEEVPVVYVEDSLIGAREDRKRHDPPEVLLSCCYSPSRKPIESQLVNTRRSCDGNPAEHTPASTHTDHAIFGYTYEFRFIGYEGSVLERLAKRVSNPFKLSKPRTVNVGIAYDALEQALCARGATENLVHHSDRGVQYVSIRYTERLAEAGIEPSVGSVGDSYDNALAESIIGLYKTEVIEQLGPWNSMVAVEIETLGWVEWFNNRRLLEPIGYVPPAEFEELYDQAQRVPAAVAGLK